MHNISCVYLFIYNQTIRAGPAFNQQWTELSYFLGEGEILYYICDVLYIHILQLPGVTDWQDMKQITMMTGGDLRLVILTFCVCVAAVTDSDLWLVILPSHHST